MFTTNFQHYWLLYEIVVSLVDANTMIHIVILTGTRWLPTSRKLFKLKTFNLTFSISFRLTQSRIPSFSDKKTSKPTERVTTILDYVWSWTTSLFRVVETNVGALIGLEWKSSWRLSQRCSTQGVLASFFVFIALYQRHSFQMRRLLRNFHRSWSEMGYKILCWNLFGRSHSMNWCDVEVRSCFCHWTIASEIFC